MSFWDQFQEVGQSQAQSEIVAPAASQPSSIQPQQQPAVQDFWSQFKDVERPESTGEMITRNVAGALGTAFSSALGLPGDIEALGRSVISGRQEGEGGLVGKISPEPFLPTSQKLKERFEEVHPELKTKGKTEELIREVAGDYVLAPGGAARKLGIAAFGVLGKEAAKELGAGDKGQIGAKIVSGVLASRFGQKNVKDFINKEYAKADSAIPKSATVPSKRAETYLSQVREKVKEGGHADWKKPVLDQIETLEKNFTDGKIKVNALNQAVKDINSELGSKGIRGTQADMWLTRIKKATQHELKQYGKENPEFLNHWKDANSAFAGFAQSKKAAEFLNKYKTKLGLSGGTALLAEYLIAGPQLAVQAITSLGAAYGVGKSFELTSRIFSNPVLANYYLKATAAAAKENSKQLLVNLNKLDQGLKKTNPNKERKVL